MKKKIEKYVEKEENDMERNKERIEIKNVSHTIVTNEQMKSYRKHLLVKLL